MVVVWQVGSSIIIIMLQQKQQQHSLGNKFIQHHRAGMGVDGQTGRGGGEKISSHHTPTAAFVHVGSSLCEGRVEAGGGGCCGVVVETVVGTNVGRQRQPT